MRTFEKDEKERTKRNLNRIGNSLNRTPQRSRIHSSATIGKGVQGSSLPFPSSEESAKQEKDSDSIPEPPSESPQLGRKAHSTLSSSVRVQSFVVDEHLSSQQFAFLPSLKYLFSCSHWDHSLRVTNVETGKLIQAVREHHDIITCLTLSRDYGKHWLVTGSKDCTLMVWDVQVDKEMPFGQHPLHVLYGHDDAVTTVAVLAEFDLVASGSEDGIIILHNLRDGTYIRSIVDVGSAIYSSLPEVTELPNSSGLPNAVNGVQNPVGLEGAVTATIGSQPKRITWIGISREGLIVCYAADEQVLRSYTINGFLLATRFITEVLYAITISDDGKVLLTGGSNCLIVLRWVRFSILQCTFTLLITVLV